MSTRLNFDKPPESSEPETAKKKAVVCACCHSIRIKTLCTLVLSFCILLIIMLGVLLGVFPASFANLETSFIKNANQRVKRTLFQNFKSKIRVGVSFAIWDETYKLPDLTPEDTKTYLEYNFGANYMTIENINFASIYALNGSLLGSISINLETGVLYAYDVPSEYQTLSPSHPLLKNVTVDLQARTGGYAMYGGKLAQITATPILKSDASGPSNGILVLGRFMDAKYVSEQAFKNEQCVGFYTLTNTNDETVKRLSSQISNVKPVLVSLSTQNWQNNEAFLVESFARGTTISSRLCIDDNYTLPATTTQEARIVAYSVIADMYGKPIFIVSSDTSRNLLELGVGGNVGAAAGFAVISIVASIVIMLFIEFIVLRPTISLSKKVKQIGDSGDVSQRVNVKRADELGIMSKEIDKTLESLEQTNNSIKAQQEQLQVAIQRISVEEQKTKSVMDAIPDIILLCTKDAKIVQANKSFYSALKYKEAKSENLLITRVIPSISMEQYEKMIQEGSGKPLDVEISTTFGEKLHFSLTIFGVKFILDDKEHEGFVVVAHSLTEQKKLLDSLQNEQAKIAQMQNVLEFEGYMKTPLIKNAFKAFCKQNHNDEMILFAEAVEEYKSLKAHDRIGKQQEIIDKFLSPDAPHLLNISGQTLENEVYIIKQGVGQINLFDKLDSLIKVEMVNDAFQRFYKMHLADGNSGSRLSTLSY